MTKPKYHIRTYYSCDEVMRDKLDRESSDIGISKSELIRKAINYYFDTRKSFDKWITYRQKEE